MSKKYKEEINKIVMNDDMKKRILQNVLARNDNGAKKNMKVKTTIPKVKKFNDLKRNMQMLAACGSIVLCVSVAKNYPMFFNHTPNDLEQKETAKSHDDENNDLKTSDDNEFVYSNGSKEISNDNHKEDQALDQNYNSDDGYVKVEGNISSKIEQEEKDKDNSKSSSSSEREKSQPSQNNDDKAIENSDISSKTKPKEDINNKENKNLPSTEPKTTAKDIMKNEISGNDTENGASVTSVIPKKAVNYSQEYKTLEEAEKALNLKVNPLKTLIKGFEVESISVISNEIIQVEYNDANNNIVFRAGTGTYNISGDYNVYKVKNTAKVNGINVNLEGNKSEEYNLAVWEKDGISYSISAEKGIDEKTILDMIL